MAETLTYDNLFAGSIPAAVTEVVTLKRGSGTLARGTVLGKITKGAATAAAKTGGNTGNATIALDSTTPVLKGAKVGVYTVRFTAATAFTVADPDGFVLGTGATGAAFVNDLKFTITAGGSAFIAGDGFDITLAAGSGYCVAVNSAAVDGSDVPFGVLCEDVVLASGAETLSAAYMMGTFNEDALVFGGSDDKEDHRAAMRNLNMYMKTTVPVA